MDHDENVCHLDIGGGIKLQVLEDLRDDDDDVDVEECVGRFVWPTAVPMLNHLRREMPALASSTIAVELGAGCGVLSMGLAATRHFHNVIITDHDEMWLERNLTLNSKLFGEGLMIMRLDWGNTVEIEAVRALINDACHSMDNPNLLIFASDVLYNHKSHQKLASTLHSLSSIDQIPTRILIGFLSDRDNDEASFLLKARELFGDEFPESKSVFVERKGKTKTIAMHLIDFVVR
ncbi:hypothetical protein HJC23_008354 [Cyclotella cryptica]|uniref:Calmodulin-lysine N-methyltransferase n=1 Tax=Cyclotella cryptica TaxID=29204 RepID=A0ABD3Q5X5_9STRA